MSNGTKFPMPESSWEAIKKILRGYRAVQDQDSPTVEGIAKLAGIHRPILSMNNNFLRELGIVQPEKYKLTEVGQRLATVITMNSPAVVQGSIKTIVRGNAFMNTLLGMLDARGGMPIKEFRVELMLLVGMNEKSRQLPFIKTILDMFQDGGLITIEGDQIALPGERSNPTTQASQASAVETRPAQPVLKPSAGMPSSEGVPLALGPNRIAYVVLPEDWDGTKDLKKFLKLAELALGDDVND